MTLPERREAGVIIQLPLFVDALSKFGPLEELYTSKHYYKTDD
jgi:hypothetical protein